MSYPPLEETIEAWRSPGRHLIAEANEAFERILAQQLVVDEEMEKWKKTLATPPALNAAHKKMAELNMDWLAKNGRLSDWRMECTRCYPRTTE